MKYLSKLIITVLLLSGIVASLTGCSSGKKEVVCPFTEITWDNTLADIEALEGELLESYYSTYKGTTYLYEKEYMGLKGTIKYMFDDKEALKSIAWMYLPESSEELESVYADLVTQTSKLYGNSGFDSDMSTAKGQVWYLEGGNIVLGVMSTGVNEAIQYQFLHPDVSSEKPTKDNSKSKSVLKEIFN